MDFRILGPLEVRSAERPVALGGAKQRALLAILLLNANEVIATDRLIAELWGERTPETAAKGLQGYVSALRKALSCDTGAARDVLVTRPPGYAILLESEQLDLSRFERLRAEARTAIAAGDAAGARARLSDAFSLWRGQPLADFAYEPFAQTAISRLEELRLATLEERLDADLALGRHSDLIGELETLVLAHPLRERFRAQVMLALYRCGRQAEALEAYRAARQSLVEELGIEPGRELRELHEAILRQDPGLELVAVPEPAIGASRGHFVGRERELAELVAGLDDAFAGYGRLFLLAGEPGIGKSRLAEELIADARGRGAHVLVGRCWEEGGAPAYWPWVQSLRGYPHESDGAALGLQAGAGGMDLAQIVPELCRLFPELCRLFPDLPDPPAPDSEGARFRLFDATAQFLRSASKQRPIVLVLDDLHAADAPSLLLLQFIARELSSTRVLLLGAYRDVDPLPGQPLNEMLAEVVREPATRRLSLGGLSEREVVEYVELTAAAIGSSALARALHQETHGNPLFVGEIVRLISVEGVSCGFTASGHLVIPQSVRDVIARRLAHLSAECSRLLALASVIGREFTLAGLARLGHVSEDVLLDVLDEAMAARVVSDVPGAPAHLRFAHVLIRDTLYEGLTPARRVRLHRLVVETLEALYGEQPGPHLAELAQHSIAGGDYERGLRYAQRAGDRALALLAYEESARLYDRALDALERGDLRDERARCELHLSLGEAEARAGNSAAAKRAFVEAAAIARRLGLPRELARAAVGYGGRSVWARAGDDDRLVPLLEEGLAALAEDDVELRARLLARLAGALRDEHSRERRDRLSAEAVELARRSRSVAALAYALDGRAAAIVAPDTVAEGLALGSELRELAEASGDPERVVSAHLWRVIAQLQVGDVRGAELDLATASRISEELRQPAPLWEVRSAQAMLALAAGRLEEAEELVRESFALGERAEPEGAIPVHRLQQYALCDLRGSLEEAEPAICDLIAEYPARPVFRCAAACLHARLGRETEARRALADLAQDDFSGLPFDQEWLYGICLLAETAVLLGDIDCATVLYGLLLPWERFNAVDMAEGFRGSVGRYLGLLATATRRWEEASTHFEAAVAMNARMGARPLVAQTQEDHARMLAARGETGDRSRALDLTREALATYRDLGIESWAAAAADFERTLRAAAARGQ